MQNLRRAIANTEGAEHEKMSTIKFKQFREFASQHNVFDYNRALVESSITGLDKLFKDALVLDVGAGTRLKHFKHHMADARHVVGIDMALQDLVQNRDVNSKAIGNAEQLPFSSSSFDAIVCVDVVEHLTDPAMFLREAQRVLRPGGKLVICTPNLLGYKNIVSNALPRPVMDMAWRVFKHREAGQPHRTYYRSNTVRRMAKLATENRLTVQQAHYLDEISHFYYDHPALCTLAYAYGRLLRGLHLNFFLNYMVCVLSKERVVVKARNEDPTLPIKRKGRRRTLRMSVV
jgi:ubiquinone/menaquinone biosynthesis C-methylase UbiE